MMLEVKPPTFFWRHCNCLKWGETSFAVFRHHMPLHDVISTERFFANWREPTHVNFSGAECRPRKRYNVAHLYRFTPPPSLFHHHHHHHHHISIVFFLHHHHYISIVFFFHHHHHEISIFSPPTTTTTFLSFSSSTTSTTFLLFSSK